MQIETVKNWMTKFYKGDERAILYTDHLAALKEAVKEKDSIISRLRSDLCDAKIRYENALTLCKEKQEQITALKVEAQELHDKYGKLWDETKRLREALERISRYDSYHQEWPNDIYINAPPEELASFALDGINYQPEVAKDALKQGKEAKDESK